MIIPPFSYANYPNFASSRNYQIYVKKMFTHVTAIHSINESTAEFSLNCPLLFLRAKMRLILISMKMLKIPGKLKSQSLSMELRCNGILCDKDFICISPSEPNIEDYDSPKLVMHR